MGGTDSECTCSHKWVNSMGVLYGVKMMGGMVRTDTNPTCPTHFNYVPRKVTQWPQNLGGQNEH